MEQPTMLFLTYAVMKAQVFAMTQNLAVVMYHIIHILKFAVMAFWI